MERTRMGIVQMKSKDASSNHFVLWKKRTKWSISPDVDLWLVNYWEHCKLRSSYWDLVLISINKWYLSAVYRQPQLMKCIHSRVWRRIELFLLRNMSFPLVDLWGNLGVSREFHLFEIVSCKVHLVKQEMMRWIKIIPWLGGISTIIIGSLLLAVYVSGLFEWYIENNPLSPYTIMDPTPSCCSKLLETPGHFARCP